MPFELRTRVGRGNHALGGVQISHGKGNSGGKSLPLKSIGTFCGEPCKNSWTDRDNRLGCGLGWAEGSMCYKGEHWCHCHLMNTFEPFLCACIYILFTYRIYYSYLAGTVGPSWRCLWSLVIVFIVTVVIIIIFLCLVCILRWMFRPTTFYSSCSQR